MMSVHWQCPKGAAAPVVLAHGADARMSHRNMQGIADAPGRFRIETPQFNFPFVEAGRSRTDPQPAAVAAAFQEAKVQTTCFHQVH